MSQVTISKIVEGAANLVIRVDLRNEGIPEELTDHVFLSPSDCVPARANDQPNFRIMQMWYSLAWFDVVLKFGTLQPEFVWTLARDSGNYIDFRSFGGIVDTRSNPPGDENGKLLLSTNGFSTPGAHGSIILALRKLT